MILKKHWLEIFKPGVKFVIYKSFDNTPVNEICTVTNNSKIKKYRFGYSIKASDERGFIHEYPIFNCGKKWSEYIKKFRIAIPSQKRIKFI